MTLLNLVIYHNLFSFKHKKIAFKSFCMYNLKNNTLTVNQRVNKVNYFITMESFDVSVSFCYSISKN